MNDRIESIAEQALRALRVRRQWESGELTYQGYLASLDVLDEPPDQAAAHPTGPATETALETSRSKSDQPAGDSRPKLIGALEVLQPRRRLEDAQLAPQQYLPQTNLRPDTAYMPVQEPASVATTTPTAARLMPAAPAIVTRQKAREPNLILRWKRRPRNRWLLAAAGGTFVLIAALQAFAFRERTGISRIRAVQDTATTGPAVLPDDLVVSEAGFVGPVGHRRVAGVLKNRSGKTYTGIQLTFCLVGRDGDTVGLVTASVDHIAGRQTARFESPDVKAKAAEMVLQEIETHPLLAGAP